MKKNIVTMFLGVCMLVVSSLAVGCNNVKVTLSTENDITTLKPGESTQILMDIEDDKIVLEISDGEQYATLSKDGVLTIKNDAKVGEVVTTVAKKDNKVVSNELDITIASVLAQSITATATSNNTNIAKGGIVELSYTTNPANVTEDITWKITEGNTYASIIGEKYLSVSANAPYDTVIKVKAVSESNVASNELTFTVASISLTALEISSIPASSEVKKNDQIALNYVATPANTTETITYSIVEGSDYATLNGNVLKIKNNAQIGATIKVKAQGSTVSSNVLTFTVVTSSQEQRNIMASTTMTADSATSSSNTLVIQVLDGNMNEVTNENVNYEVVDGEEFLALDHENGTTCDLQVLGHGTAKIKVSVAGATDKLVTVNCLKAPDSIMVPEALVEKTGIEFATGVNQEIAGFAFTTTGTNVCTTMNYTIEKWNTSSNAYENTTAGTYAENKLKFTETGKFRIVANSASGSSRNVTKEVVFNVNDAVNVNNYEDFRTNLLAGKAVNIMNLTNKNGTYNYNLVPSAILNGTQTSNSYADIAINIRGYNVKINGNGFKLDLSQLAYYQENTFEYGSLISVKATLDQDALYETKDCNNQDEKNAKKRNETRADYFVEINNLDIVGNVHVDGRIADHDYDTNLQAEQTSSLVLNSNQKPQGRLRSSFYRGIAVGQDTIYVAYQVSMNNVDVSGFTTGMRLCHAVNSSLTNCSVGDCFQNGIETVASKMTLTNMAYGLCGATGIEITPNEANAAGLNFSENQSITFAGSITVYRSSLNDGATPYMQIFSVQNGGASIIQLLQGSMMDTMHSSITEENAKYAVMSNVATITEQTPKFGLIALIFGGSNPSQLIYSNELDDGITNFSNITTPTDNHQYVVLDLINNLGSALLYNLNFLPQE